MQSREYSVIGDDGTHWIVGSRGNDPAILRQEITCNEFLLPEEKAEILTWLDGDRKLREADDAALICLVDGHYCDRIRNGPPTTEGEILASGLPDRTIENLLYNFRNYRSSNAVGPT